MNKNSESAGKVIMRRVYVYEGVKGPWIVVICNELGDVCGGKKSGMGRRTTKETSSSHQQRPTFETRENQFHRNSDEREGYVQK